MPIQNSHLLLDGESLTIADVVAVANQPEIQVSLSEEAWARSRGAKNATIS